MKIRQIIIAFLTFILLIVAISVSILSVQEVRTADLNSSGDSLLTTTSISHAIWVPIYLLLGIFSLYQLMPDAKDKDFIDSEFPWFSITLVANTVWWVTKLFKIPYISPVLIFIMIVSLIMSYYFLNYYLPKFNRFQFEDRLLVYGTVSAYLGWVVILFLGEVSETLIYMDLTQLALPAIFWAPLVVILIGMITVYILLVQIDVPFGLVILWGLYGINSHRGIYSINNNVDTTYLNYAFWIVAIVIAISILYALYDWNQRRAIAALQESYF